jgi:large subunit ribosomal protein L29
MKASELRAKSAAELRVELLKLRKEQFALRLQRATGQPVKPDQFGKVRRSIARLKTAMRAGQSTSQSTSQLAGQPVAVASARLAVKESKAASKAAPKSAARPAKKTGAK